MRALSENDSYAVPALEKGLDVLELLASAPDGLTKSQIARALNRTASEIFRMLICLERRGYIAQVEGERVSLTLKMFKMVQQHPPTERLIATALPVMYHLAHDILQSCHLAVLEGGRLVILSQVNAPTPIGFFVKPGSTVDIMEAASGYVLLAHMSDAQRERTLRDWKREAGRAMPRGLNSHLKRIAQAGFERQGSYLVKGVTNLSCPILDGRQSAVAALTVPFIELSGSKVKEPEVLKALREAAGEISTAIGGTSPG
ncbi:IclR family transcriptional regulator [Acidipila sp. EB88]|uniref:IclR family transcriptional regulator n=1 Tax=Acidipila sp. EB88 TaxID=2305226 RepID=UPI003511F060